MRYNKDSKGQRYVEWQAYPGIFKRAWIQYRTGYADWAGTGRYLNVVHVGVEESGPRGQIMTFPVYYDSSQMGDEQILSAFVYSLCAATGRKDP